LYIQLCKEQDLERLKEVFDFQKKADLLAFVFVKEAYETEVRLALIHSNRLTRG
jgi:hypothetical protein